MKTTTKNQTNTTDLQDDGARWKLRYDWKQDTDANIFRSWGATQIYALPENYKNGRIGDFYMIELEDGWHVAHSDHQSAYASKQVFEAVTGEIAWFQFEASIAAEAVHNRQRDLATAFDNERTMMRKLSEAIYREYSKARMELADHNA